MDKDTRTSDFESDDKLPDVQFPDWVEGLEFEERMKEIRKHGAYVAEQDMARIRENMRKYRAQESASE